MKVGIVTITDGSNYGNNLQNYALIQTLKKLGVSAETIRTNYEYDFFARFKNKSHRMVKTDNHSTAVTDKKEEPASSSETDHSVVVKQSRIKKLLRYYYREKRALRFKRFSNQYLNKSKESVTEKTPVLNKNYDCLVFGSDQIWNFTINRVKNNPDYYTGNFAPDTKKVAFSASLGTDYIPDEYCDVFAKHVGNFDAISVREESGVKPVEELIQKPVNITLDPTLLLSKKEWLACAKKPHYVKKNEKILVTYFLGDKDKALIDFINRVAEKYHLTVVNITMEWVEIDNAAHFCTSPDEFVWLINAAELVLTDSFHASVFSIIMEKPFRFFERKQHGLKKMTSRVENLADKLKIDKWYKGDNEEKIEHVLYCDYKNASSVMRKEKEKTNAFLKESLNLLDF